MNIGILTFHNALNFGATLQAYALLTFLKNRGYECEVINYINPKMMDEISLLHCYKHSSGLSKAIHLLNLHSRKCSYKHYSEFFKKNMAFSGEIISTIEELKRVNDKYDAIVVGSDQVFNIQGTGEDFNFYLEFTNKRKIAYAPSFGMVKVDKKYQDRIRNDLLDFNFLSARESEGRNIIKVLTDRDVPIVCDPTFLLEKKAWEKFDYKKTIKKPYVLVYSFGSRHLDKKALQIAKRINGIVINVNRALPSLKIKSIKGIGPDAFIGLLKNADYVLTNSFHGMALSVILNKNFTVYLNNYENAKNSNPRFVTLAQKLGLENRIKSINDNPNMDSIDYNTINKKIYEWRTQSSDYLTRALKIEV